MFCFKYHGYSHVAAQCPSKNLLIRKADDDEIETIVYEPTSSTIDSDDDARVSSIKLVIVGCSNIAFRNEDWRKSNVFHTYITHEGKNY